MYEDEQINLIKDWLGKGSINIFGRPFSGKDSQGRILSEILDGIIISSGEMFRKNIIEDSVKSIIDAGNLAPSQDFINLILPYFNQDNLKEKALILSSVGRWNGEENYVIESLEKSNHPLKAVVHLIISDDEARVRQQALLSNDDRLNRADDTASVLENRFNEFATKTLPVINHYRDLNLLIEIDGNQSREKVTENIIIALTKYISNKNNL